MQRAQTFNLGRTFGTVLQHEADQVFHLANPTNPTATISHEGLCRSLSLAEPRSQASQRLIHRLGRGIYPHDHRHARP